MATPTVILDCARIDNPDLGAIHILATATLQARRDGWQTRLLYVSRELTQLIAFVGLEGILLVAAGFPPRS
jgi:ABC-type transporter Mla MlaB component